MPGRNLAVRLFWVPNFEIRPRVGTKLEISPLKGTKSRDFARISSRRGTKPPILPTLRLGSVPNLRSWLCCDLFRQRRPLLAVPNLRFRRALLARASVPPRLGSRPRGSRALLVLGVASLTVSPTAETQGCPESCLALPEVLHAEAQGMLERSGNRRCGPVHLVDGDEVVSCDADDAVTGIF